MAKPKYEKIAVTLQNEILRGIFPQNSRLPKIIDLAVRFNVSYVTMSNAIQLLAQNGYVNTMQGNGVFVTSSLPNKYKSELFYFAPIDGDIYCRCFRTVQNYAYDHNIRLNISMHPEKFYDLAKKKPEHAESLLREYCSRPLLIDGTRHFPYPLLKKINPSGRGIYFFMHCDCPPDWFPEAVIIIPDFHKIGILAAEKLHKSAAERLFLLSYEKLTPEMQIFAGNISSSYDKFILDGMNDYAASHRLPPVKVIRGQIQKYNQFNELLSVRDAACGFMAVGDVRAYQLYRFAKINNISPSDKWHVIGLGKTDWCDIIEPQLVSIALREIPLMKQILQEISLKSHSKHILWQPEIKE